MSRFCFLFVCFFVIVIVFNTIYIYIDRLMVGTGKCRQYYFKERLTQGWRRGGVMVSALDSGSSGPGSGPGRVLAGSLCCALGQDTLLSRCVSLPRCING